MKKLLTTTLCCIICCVSLFAFTACGNKALPDFKDCEIGYELEVYPKFAFDFILDTSTDSLINVGVAEGTIIRIETISVKLSAKLYINENEANTGNAYDSLYKKFYPYEVESKITGSTDPSYAGRKIAVELNIAGALGVVKEDGTFEISSKNVPIHQNQKVFFIATRL